MTEASQYLFGLAERIAGIYASETDVEAILLTGSAATGESDYYSDLDLILYYETLPKDATLARARERVGVDQILFAGGDRDEGQSMEMYLVHGIECQLAHVTLDVWERDLASVLEKFEAITPMQKAIDGLLHGRALLGDDLIRNWQERARAYPDGLARAMITAHLRFAPVWRIEERLRTRDASLFFQQSFVEASQSLLGVLAGLNQVYYSSFQFKRLHAFTAQLRIAPHNLADRLNRLFASDPATAAADLERLVAETLDLVQLHRPDVDVTKARQHLGARDRPWKPPDAHSAEDTRSQQEASERPE